MLTAGLWDRMGQETIADDTVNIILGNTAIISSAILVNSMWDFSYLVMKLMV